MKMVPLLSSVLLSMALTACSPPAEYEPEPEPLPDDDVTMTEEDRRPERIAMARDENQHSNCELTLGYGYWEPYQYLDISERARGLDIEIAQAVAERMDCTLDLHHATWVDLVAGIQEGDIDFVMGASKTQDREDFGYFSDPYREEEFVLFIRAGEGHRYSASDLREFLQADAKVGIVNEYYYGDQTHHMIIREDTPDYFVGASISEVNIDRLLEEEIDGFLEDRAVGLSMIRRQGVEDLIEPSQITLESSDVYALFSQETVNEDRVDNFNEALQEIRESGEYEAITTRYLK